MSGSGLARLIRRVLFRRKQDDQDIEDELRFHLTEETRLHSDRGESDEAARRAARLDFGSVSLAREDTRDVWVWRHAERLLQDLQYAARTFRRTPGVAVLIIASLTVGIAGTIAALAFVNAVVFRPFPGMTAQDDLVEVDVQRRYGETSTFMSLPTSTADYQALTTTIESIAGLAAFDETSVSTRLPAPRALGAVLASENYFDVLGLQPEVGRGFLPEEGRPENAAVAVISYGLWVREFGSDPGAVAELIEVAGQSVRIVGVAPRHFVGLSPQILSPRFRTDLWLPLALADRVSPSPTDGPRTLRFVGRLADGATVQRAASEAELVAGMIARTRQEEPESIRTSVFRLSVIPARDHAQWAGLLALVLVVPALVLVIGCVNAANLLLARASHRHREIAIRLAIGASRRRVIRQILSECLLLSLLAAAVGIPLTWAGLQAAESFLPIPMPMDGTLAIAVVALTIATAAGFGLAPAFRSTRAMPGLALGTAQSGVGGEPSQVRGRRAVVAAQVAVSLCLLAAGAQALSALGLVRASAGESDPDRLLLASFDLSQLSYSPAEATAFYDRLLASVSVLPESAGAGLARRTALWYLRAPGGQRPPGQIVRGPGEERGRDHYGGFAGGSLFQAVGLRVLEGRAFTPEDRGGPPRVAIINQPAADRLEGPAPGQTLTVLPRRPEGGPVPGFAPLPVRVVGVVESALDPGIATIPQPAIYLPSPLTDELDLTLYVRADGPIESLAAGIREAVDSSDPRVPFVELATLGELNRNYVAPQRGFARGLWIFGMIALALATFGLYGVTAYIVSARSREVAIRLALGARPGQILKLMLGQALVTAGVGVAIGLVGSIALGVIIRSEILHAPGFDFASFAGPAALLTASTLLAVTVPSLRAIWVDPVATLRNE